MLKEAALLLEVHEHGNPEHIPFLVVKLAGEVGEGQLSAELDAQLIHPQNAYICVVVLRVPKSTFLHISAIYLLCTRAALTPFCWLSAALSGTPV